MCLCQVVARNYLLVVELYSECSTHQGVSVELGASIFVPMGESLGRGNTPAPWVYTQVGWVL